MYTGGLDEPAGIYKKPTPMTQELKDAIITIAEYDGWKKSTSKRAGDWFKHQETMGVCKLTQLEYHTSAEALLQVWRKVNEILPIYNNDNVSDVADEILYGYYESACIQLANIIKELK